METAAEILKITIPATIVFLTAWIILRNMIKNDGERRKQEIILQNSRTITPIRLQAYERVVLFLERISLDSLLVRISISSMNAVQLQSALISSIRSEYEHNLSQQIYMTPQAWEVLKNAKSNMIKIINGEFEKMPKNASGIEFSRKLLETIMQLEKEPTKAAIDYIKGEITRLIQ